MKNELNDLRRQLSDLVIRARLLQSLDPKHQLHQQQFKQNYQKQNDLLKRIKSISNEDWSDHLYETASHYLIENCKTINNEKAYVLHILALLVN